MLILIAFLCQAICEDSTTEGFYLGLQQNLWSNFWWRFSATLIFDIQSSPILNVTSLTEFCGQNIKLEGIFKIHSSLTQMTKSVCLSYLVTCSKSTVLTLMVFSCRAICRARNVNRIPTWVGYKYRNQSLIKLWCKILWKWFFGHFSDISVLFSVVLRQWVHVYYYKKLCTM